MPRRSVTSAELKLLHELLSEAKKLSAMQKEKEFLFLNCRSET